MKKSMVKMIKLKKNKLLEEEKDKQGFRRKNLGIKEKILKQKNML